MAALQSLPASVEGSPLILWAVWCAVLAPVLAAELASGFCPVGKPPLFLSSPSSVGEDALELGVVGYFNDARLIGFLRTGLSLLLSRGGSVPFFSATAEEIDLPLEMIKCLKDDS